MKRLFFYCLLALIPTCVVAQGIHFSDDLSWSQIVAKARAENKYIFVDCYTTWCGPCRSMKENVFPLKDVGDFYNAHFISVSVQMDSTRKDNDTVRNWYAEAHAMKTRFGVNVFPTYLYFSPDGQPVHEGNAAIPVASFIALGEDALNPAKQLFPLVSRFETGDRDTSLCKQIAELTYFSDHKIAGEAADAYIAQMPDQLTKANLMFICQYTFSVRSRAFHVLLDNLQKAREVIGAYTVDMTLINAIVVDESDPFLGKSATSTDWKVLEGYLNKKYPAIAAEAFGRAKDRFYYEGKDYRTYVDCFSDFYKKYPQLTPMMMLNTRAWDMFRKSSDKHVLTVALGWSKACNDAENNATYKDTYANLCYKLGRKEEAMKWEQDAINMSSDADDKKPFEVVLEKMKKGEATWPQS